ncbi:MAG: hypothetical protein LBH29_05220 [Elusimicrobiota bacterium]|jgi:hypothetical protein|nr:hypothetical protein [Elusimicrobiota bacterium]
MENFILNNAFGILGLMPDVSQKETAKRSGDLEKLINIDEIPKYPCDFGVFQNLRNLNSIKEAQTNLSNMKKKILHSFFRVYALSERENAALAELENNFTFENIKNYAAAFKNAQAKKNAAVLMFLFLSQNKSLDGDAAFLLIEIWKELLTDKKHFQNFKKLFLLSDEIGVDESVLDGSFEEIKKSIAASLADLPQFERNSAAISAVMDAFSLDSSELNIKQIDECYEKIDEAVKSVNNADRSDLSFLFLILKNEIKIIESNLNKLIDFNLYENAQSINIRDRIAETLNFQIMQPALAAKFDSISVFTQVGLLDIAIEICGTAVFRAVLEDKRDKMLYIFKEVLNESRSKVFEDLAGKTNLYKRPVLQTFNSDGTIFFDLTFLEKILIVINVLKRQKQNTSQNQNNSEKNRKAPDLRENIGCYIVVVIIAVLFLFAICSEQNSKTESQTQTQNANLKEQPLPQNAARANLTKKRENIPFKVSASKDAHYYIKLVDFYTGKDAFLLFVRAGQTAEIEVPAGIYKIKYASGETSGKWYGWDYLFGSKTSYSASDEKLSFEISGGYARGHQITLYKVRDGNFRTQTIKPSDF